MEAEVSCEALMEDEDMRRQITRDELEQLIAPFVVRFRKCLEESLAKSGKLTLFLLSSMCALFILFIFDLGLTNEEIDFVELVGEATRIPICIKQIKEVFQKDPSRTLNSTDCIARGCALQAAMLSAHFGVANFQVEEYNSEPISITYKFKDSDKPVTKEMFKKGSSFPSSSMITVYNKAANLELMVHYADDAALMDGLSSEIANYVITDGKKDDVFTMRVSNNIHNIARLEEVELTNKSKVNFTTESQSLSPAVKKQFYEAEMALRKGDLDILEWKELRNTLEAYSYDMRSNLDADGKMVKYIEEVPKKAFVAQLNHAVEWLYDAGKSAPKAEYAKKIREFKQIGEPVKQRYFYYSELDLYFTQFEEMQTSIAEKLTSIDHFTWAAGKKYEIALKQKPAVTFMEGVKADKASKTLTQNPNYKLDSIIDTLNTLKKESDAIFNRPQPVVVEPAADAEEVKTE